jgi:hypothetical protein
MTKSVRTLLFAASAGLLALSSMPLGAQGSRAVPRTPYSSADLSKLKWLEGTWVGTSTEEAATYQRIHFADDSTIVITYYRDPSFTQETGTGRLYVSVGRIYHTFGSNRWVATRVDTDGIYLVPQTSTANNNFAWSYQSPDTWTTTMRTGAGGHERVIVYSMKRQKP